VIVTAPDTLLPAEKLGRVHFVGIGGAGMSGIARIMASRGIEVSGSDAKDGKVLAALRALGATCWVGHAAEHVKDADTVVVSTAIRETNPEVVAARAAGIPILPRAAALASVMVGRRTLAVAGTHGKTTTTSMLTVALQHCAADPSYAIGGNLNESGSNAHDGTGDLFVAEADESDGSFLRLAPAVTVVTNIDREHLDHYKDLDDIRQAFVYFANRVPFYGVAVLCVDDDNVRAILPKVTKRSLLYGTRPEAEIRGVSIEMMPHGSRFRVEAAGERLGLIELHVPGRHNALNALAAVAVGLELEITFEHIAESLAGFRGVGRRFELRGEVAGVRVVDDYGHHPTEIAATLAAAKGSGSGRVLVVFQPHRYTRTASLREEFGRCFGDADLVWVMDVYAAGEPPIPGVSGETVVASARAHGASHVHFAPTAAEAVEAAVREARAGDVVLTLGAGDVSKLGEIILDGLKAGKKAPSPAVPSSGRGGR
jgi:UDP-N-acetylmuramate--alanine ligase